MRHSTPTTQRKRSNPKSETEDDVVYSKPNPYKVSELIKRSKWIQENSEKNPSWTKTGKFIQKEVNIMICEKDKIELYSYLLGVW